MQKVCAYLMNTDSGLAPNPFHGVGTLAVCTPNHARARLEQGDWIIGLPAKQVRHDMGSPDWRLFYAMQVEERMELDDYYRDSRYQSKIPKRNGTPIERRGDNFYCKQGSKLVHTNETDEHHGVQGDITGNRVFISRRAFWYFGKDAVVLPDAPWASKLVGLFEKSGRNIRYVHGRPGDRWTPNDFAQFKRWLESQQAPARPVPYHFQNRLDDTCRRCSPTCGCSPRKTASDCSTTGKCTSCS